MSKKRRRSRSQDYQCENCKNNPEKLNNGLGNNPFGINPSQLMGMLGNIDMGQIGNILSSMNRDGFDLNNLNLGSMQNTMSGISGSNMMSGMNSSNMMSGMGMNDNKGAASVQEMINNISNLQGNNIKNKGNLDINNRTENNNSNSKINNNSKIKRNKENRENINDLKIDENIEMLMDIRKIVKPDRIKFIDKVIELYNTGIFEE